MVRPEYHMRDGYEVRVVRPDELDRLWPEVRPLLEPAIPFCNGEFEVDDLRDLVVAGKAFIVALEDERGIALASVFEVLCLPRKTVLNVLVTGGSKLNVLIQQFWDRLDAIGRTLGAEAIRGAVRPAMQRYYRRIAPEAAVAYTILERKL